MLCVMTLLPLKVSSLAVTSGSLHAACQQHGLDGVQRTPLQAVVSVWQV